MFDSRLKSDIYVVFEVKMELLLKYLMIFFLTPQ